jgi:pre-rRNA-processing protein TSR4
VQVELDIDSVLSYSSVSQQRNLAVRPGHLLTVKASRRILEQNTIERIYVMWAQGEDFGEDGDRVRLYQPILYGRKPNILDLTSCHVGGACAPACCTVCGNSLLPLAQLYVSEIKRTLQVLACNQASCFRTLFSASDSNDRTRNALCFGGGGVVRCYRRSVADKKAAPLTSETVMEATTDWTSNDVLSSSAVANTNADKNNEWDIKGGENTDDMDDLESKLVAMEANGPISKIQTQNQPAKQVAATSTIRDAERPGFPCFELHSLCEPAIVQNLDADDVGIGCGDDSRKIQAMLAKYMAEEDDPDILAALQGVAFGAGGGGGGQGERDERVSPADRALLTYTDRLKRSPRQVLRYAKGGTPLWSMYVPFTDFFTMLASGSAF